MNRIWSSFVAAALVGALTTSFAAAQTPSELRIGLADDPGSLDPALNASFVGRVSLQSVCDKLVDINPNGDLIPMLASSWEWSPDGKTLTMKLRNNVVFQDGTPFNADAVQFNLNRYLTMPGSRRRPEIDVIDKVDVVDPMTVRLTLKQASVSLLTQFTDRSGMMVSPTAYAKMGADAFSNHPICAGPYTIADYKPQDRLTLQKFPQHWRADQYKFDRVVFQAIPDTNVRLLNLRSGQLDLIQQVAPASVPSIEKDPSLKVSTGNQPASEMLTFNINAKGANPDFAKAAVRQAFSLAIDRNAINQVVFGGRYATGNQPFPPTNFWFDKDHPVQGRDIDAAKKKMAEAGIKTATLNLLVSTNPEEQQVAQVMQAMVADAGITLNITPMEFISMRTRAAQGDFEAYMVGSSGRVDPDLNISLMIACGVANNVGKYCNKQLDDDLAEARSTPDSAKRKPIYDKIADILQTDDPILVLYNPRDAYAMKANVQGFVPYPDGIIHLEGVTLPAAAK